MASLRSVVKHSYIRAFGDGQARAKAHVDYIKFRPGKDKDERGKREFFNDKEEGLTSHPVHDAIEKQTGRVVLVHKIIISPGVQEANTQEYVREVMHDLGRQKGLELEWYAVEHRNTVNPHAHVVVMGQDKNGRQVKLSKQDYTKLREAGDRYLERNKLLEKEKLRLKEKEAKRKPFGMKLKDALKAAKSEFDRVMRDEGEEKRLTRLETIKAQEAESLGQAPTYAEIAVKRYEKEEQVRQEAWKYYSKSIEVDFAGEAVSYSWNMPLSELWDLKRRHQAQGLLSEKDHAKLEMWIKDGYFEEKYLSRQAEELEKITIGPAESAEKLSRDSSLERLQETQKLHKSGQVVLSPVEEKALSTWLERKLEVEPIRVMIDGVSDPIVYDKQDSRESLEFLAKEYRKGEDWARDGVTEAEYKKLRRWIKEAKEKQEPEKTLEPRLPDDKEQMR